MITWMTRASFLDSAADMHTDHLAQLLHEGSDLLGGLVYGVYEEQDPGQPAGKGWYGYEVALAAYLAAANAELSTRGVSDHHHLAIANIVQDLRRTDTVEFDKPAWIEDTDVLRSHRSNMMRRWPKIYNWKGTPPNMPYVWPVVDDGGGYTLVLSRHDKALLASGDRKLPSDIKNRIENLK
jgi:hypothetical protein